MIHNAKFYCNVRCFTDPSLCHDGYTLSLWLFLRTPRGSNGAGIILNAGGQNLRVRTATVALSHERNVVTVAFRVRDGENSGTEWVSSHSTPNQRWFHLAATWKINGRLSVYQNGLLGSSRLGSSFTPLPSSTNNSLYLGKPNNQHWWHGNCSIDELYIWQHEKSAVEIHELALRSECLQAIDFIKIFCTVLFSFVYASFEPAHY